MRVGMVRTGAVGASIALLVSACSASPLALTVDLRTDYVPGRDFTSVVTELRPGSLERTAEVREASLPADSSRDFIRGVRVAEFVDVTHGPIQARVRLLNRAGAEIAERIVELDLHDSFAISVLITVSCADVRCPAPAGSPVLTQCQDGRCVDPRCSPSTPEYCPPPVCETDADCTASASCGGYVCIEGSCLCDRLASGDGGTDDGGTDGGTDGGMSTPDSGPRDAGRRDGGFDAGPPCECTVGTVAHESRACGACGTGSQQRTRTCGATCSWGAWSAYGSCSGASGCTPGATRACPNGEPCGHQTCSSSCTWSSCQLNAGAECFRIYPGGTIVGSNFRCCGTYMWQYCLSGCVWSSACSSCMPANCPMCG